MLRNPPKICSYHFDLVLVKKFGRLFTQYLCRENSKSWNLFVFLMSLLVMEQLVTYYVGMITSAFYQILGNKDLKGFSLQVVKSLLLVSCMAGIKSSKDYVAASLQISWRESLTKKLHRLYFSNDMYYKINVLNPTKSQAIPEEEMDNPDQRMTQDVNEFAKHLSSTIPKLMISPFVIVYYSYKSYEITG